VQAGNIVGEERADYIQVRVFGGLFGALIVFRFRAFSTAADNPHRWAAQFWKQKFLYDEGDYWFRNCELVALIIVLHDTIYFLIELLKGCLRLSCGKGL
jgi:hypothetical protein